MDCNRTGICTKRNCAIYIPFDLALTIAARLVLRFPGWRLSGCHELSEISTAHYTCSYFQARDGAVYMVFLYVLKITAVSHTADFDTGRNT